MAANGQLFRSALGPITKAANGEQAYLRKDAAAAFMAMNVESQHRYGVTLRVSSARVAYRTLTEQEYFWKLYTSGRGNLAARPGTSNHGWGLAVDLATPQMRSIVNAIGHKYGWAKEWSDAPSEWWHIKWREGVWHGRVPQTRPTLRKGIVNHAWVTTLQKALRRKGYFSIVVNGRYDLKTRLVVRRFQRAHRMTADGIVGDSTWRKLLG